MREKTPEEIQKIVDKWTPILNAKTPLSACKVMLIESQESPYIKSEEFKEKLKNLRNL